MRVIIISVIAGCLLFTSVRADHEPDHRYNIRGYVLNAQQQGIDNITVQASADGESLGSGKTNADGYYSMHLHLHNEDYRRVIKLRAGPYEAELQVTFDPEDTTSARIHEANFVDGQFVEGSLGFSHILSWIYPVGGLVVIMTILVFLEKRRKKKIRLAKFGSSPTHHPSGHKAKKARRKKH